MALGLLLLAILACRRRNRRRQGLCMMSPKDYVQSWSGVCAIARLERRERVSPPALFTALWPVLRKFHI